MNWYVVVTRDKAHLPVKRFVTLEAAGDFIYYERAFDRWTVLAQSSGRGAPMRELAPTERITLERRLYPGLYES